MRILLAIASNRTRNELTGALEAQGHEVVTSTSRGEELLQAIDRAMPVHVAVLTQAALGGEWSKLLRQLRRRMSGVRAVVLLRPGAEQQWRRAMMAGAFEAVMSSAQANALLEVVGRALTSTAAQSPAQPASRKKQLPAAGRSNVPPAAAGALNPGHAS